MRSTSIASLLLVGLLASAATAAPRPAPARFDAAHTRALVIGVLKWKKSKDWSSFNAKGRHDASLVETLKKSGVPSDRITYLQDRQATLAGIRQALAATLAASTKDDTLLVYYAGHGFLEKGRGYVANYDIADAPATWLGHAEIVDAIEKGFTGARAILIIDCCHSGSLIDALKKRTAGRIAYAVFTSSTAEDSSTGNWTFTQSVEDALTGSLLVDRDRDGRITAQELAQYQADEMALFEEQVASSAFLNGFDASTTLSSTKTGEVPARFGERVKVKYEGDWWNARIMQVQGERAKVRWMWIGFDTGASDEWVPLSTTRPIKLIQYETGARIEVRYKKDWYPARVLEARGCLHRVHYDGYDSSEDEWVAPRRIRRPR